MLQQQATRDKKLTVKVETLKEALSLTGLEQNMSHGGGLDRSSILASNSLSKRTHSTMESLLSGLYIGSTPPTSLANPPYPF